MHRERSGGCWRPGAQAFSSTSGPPTARRLIPESARHALLSLGDHASACDPRELSEPATAFARPTVEISFRSRRGRRRRGVSRSKRGVPCCRGTLLPLGGSGQAANRRPGVRGVPGRRDTPRPRPDAGVKQQNRYNPVGGSYRPAAARNAQSFGDPSLFATIPPCEGETLSGQETQRNPFFLRHPFHRSAWHGSCSSETREP